MGEPERKTFDPADAIRPPLDGITSSVGMYGPEEGGWIGVHLAMNDKALDQLETVVRESRSSWDAVVGKAFLLYLAAVEARREGKRVGIVGEDGTLETEFVGF